MNTELTVYEADGGERNELEQLEFEINHAAYEAFVFIGVRLLQIRKEELYRKVINDTTGKPFKSWSEYCAAGRIEYGKSQADTLIQVSTLRPKLPGMPGNSDGWTIRQLQELAKCESDKEAKTVATKVIAHAKKTGDRVTARMIAEFRDSRTSKPLQRLEAASLENHLTKLATYAQKLLYSLQSVDLEQWNNVPPAVMKRVITEVGALHTFLRS